MGRHSAPDEDEDDDADLGAPVGELAEVTAEPRGRHAAADPPPAPVEAGTEPEAEVDPLDILSGELDEPAAAEPAGAEPAGAPPAAPAEAPAAGETARAEPSPDAAPVGKQRRESGTRADLRVLRADAGLRARCVAAVLVPFIVYTLVLIVIGRTDLYLLWVVAPTVVAGVSVGAFLDVAHRRRAAPAAAESVDGTGTPSSP